MLITLKEYNVTAHQVREAIRTIPLNSRFTFWVEDQGPTRIKIKNIRLKEAKPYCGNHPNACELNTGQKPRSYKYLEGADWVEFNDRLNDVLDKLEVSAWVRSSVVTIRQNKKRRVFYGSYLEDDRFWQWEKEGVEADYQNWCGLEAPDSWYPEGTPGDYEPRKAE